MKRTNSFEIIGLILLALIFFFSLLVNRSYAKEVNHALSGNFGLPGIIDVPTARRFPDGELIFTQQLHRALHMSLDKSHNLLLQINQFCTSRDIHQTYKVTPISLLYLENLQVYIFHRLLELP